MKYTVGFYFHFSKKGIDKFEISVIIHSVDAGVAHPVERHLAKVEVASSSLVARSIKQDTRCVSSNAGVAHPVERHLAKVEVASSSLVARSNKKGHAVACPFFIFRFCFHFVRCVIK